MRILYGEQLGAETVRMIEATPKGQAILLVTPFFEPWPRLDIALRSVLAQGDHTVTFILRGGKEREKREAAVAPYVEKGARVGFYERLHAKFFVAGPSMLITSLNLLGTSAQNTWEIGVVFEKGVDDVPMEGLRGALVELLRLCENERVRIAAESTLESKKRLEAEFERVIHGSTRSRVEEGHCVRCDDAIAFNPERPHCRDCYKAWAEYSSEEYGEKYCHRCGEKTKVTKAKPLCRPCFVAVA